MILSDTGQNLLQYNRGIGQLSYEIRRCYSLQILAWRRFGQTGGKEYPSKIQQMGKTVCSAQVHHIWDSWLVKLEIADTNIFRVLTCTLFPQQGHRIKVDGETDKNVHSAQVHAYDCSLMKLEDTNTSTFRVLVCTKFLRSQDQGQRSTRQNKLTQHTGPYCEIKKC